QFYNSLKIAGSILQEKTALLYCHPSRTKELKSIQLMDRNHIQHELDLNQCAFALQKRGMLIFDYLNIQKKAGRHEISKKIISELFDYLIARYRLGISDKDPLLRKNFAVVEDHPVQIDIGTFYTFADPE